MGIVAVAIDTDKGSQSALKWAIDHLISKGSTIVLIHVKVKPTLSSNSTPRAGMNGIVEQCTMVLKELDELTKEIFRPYRVFCTQKDIHCKGIVLEHGDVSKALIEYTSQSAIEHLVIGSSNKNGFLKRNTATKVSRWAPNFCSVYIISSKGKISSMRSATVAPPCNPIYGEETMIGDLFSQEEETDGLLHMPLTSESILPSELPKSTVNLTDEPSVYKEASAIPKMTNEVSSVTEHLERVNATLMGEIPTDRAQIASLRTSLFKLANSADIPLPRREIFNQIGYEINDLAHKYNSSKEIYDHSSFDLKRLRELPETKSAFQAFYLLSFEAEKQATLRKKEIEDRMTTLTNQLEIIKKEMTELTCESSQLSTQLTILYI